MKEKITLNGEWKLYYYSDELIDAESPKELDASLSIPAKVPGNVELDMANAGLIDKELYKGMKTAENEKFEGYSWWYEKKFAPPVLEDGKKLFLSFGAVDCFAEYYINGKKVYESENAYREIRFDITDYIVTGEENTLHVHIKSALKFAFEQKYNQYLICYTREQTYMRKPAHSFGWDIFPRVVSAGIWRDVNLEIVDNANFSEFSYYVSSVSEKYAEIQFLLILDMPFSEYKKDVKVRVKGVCGDSSFESCQKMKFKVLKFSVGVNNPKLWWPYGYGEPAIYDLTYELIVDGVVRDIGKMNLGIRTVELERTETMLEDNHCFKFIVNGVDIMCRGSNWVPLDAYHSRDKERYQEALKLFTDTHCNMLRVWGGGVYESDEFYDYCDRHGIMIWHDFMMACIPVAMDERTLKNFSDEAEWAVITLRSHPSIVLWSGDNENDETNVSLGKSPDINKITRKVLPEIIEQHDTGRPYLASSPYISGEYYKDYRNGRDIFPERHLWGARDYFKADYYSKSMAHFVSEIGYHGSPCLESIEKIVDKDAIWPIFNEQWSLHSSDQKGSMHRVKLMWEQIIQLFGFEPQNIEDFILASQISQAEAKKFFIERIRIRKPYTGGLIWWNMLDGWPQMSDAVVDYFFQKKLAYHYIKRSQEPFVIMIDEMKDWNYTIVASNDTLKEVSGSYKVYDIETNEQLAAGNYTLAPNSNKHLEKIRMYYSDKRFIVIEWENNGKKYFNHYLSGMPAFDFNKYKQWLNKFNELMN